MQFVLGKQMDIRLRPSKAYFVIVTPGPHLMHMRIMLACMKAQRKMQVLGKVTSDVKAIKFCNARSPVGEFFRAKRKTNLGNVIGQRKNSPRKSWISSYFFTVRANKFA
jgi:hypothetical protein